MLVIPPLVVEIACDREVQRLYGRSAASCRNRSSGSDDDRGLHAQAHPGHDLAAQEQHGQACAGQVGAEGDGLAAAMALEEDEADAHDGADDRGHQDDGGQGLPAEPRAQGGQQLEVAVAHAFLAGEQLEEPVDAPQRQVTGHGADDGIGQRGHAVRGEVEQQPAPQQRQRQAVGQQLGVVVDEGEGHQHAAEDGGGNAGDAEAQMPDAGGGQHAGQQFHQRVAHGDGLAAFTAGAAQEEPRQHRDVFQGGDLVAAVRAA